MKTYLIVILLLVTSGVSSQSIEIRAGSNHMPGNYISLGYEHYSNSALNLSGRLFAEGSGVNGLHYRDYGIDLLAEYGSNQDMSTQSIFAFRIGFGASGQIESEPWIYRNLKTNQRMNYGFVGVLSGEWWMSENFCLSAFAEQKYLFNKILGTTRFVFGLGLKIKL